MITRAARRSRVFRPGDAAHLADMATTCVPAFGRPDQAVAGSAASRPRLPALALFALLCLALAGLPARAVLAASVAPGAAAPEAAVAPSPPAGGPDAAAQEPLPAVLETALYRLPKGDPSGQILAVLTLVSAPGWHAYAVGPAESGQSARAA